MAAERLSPNSIHTMVRRDGGWGGRVTNTNTIQKKQKPQRIPDSSGRKAGVEGRLKAKPQQGETVVICYKIDYLARGKAKEGEVIR